MQVEWRAVCRQPEGLTIGYAPSMARNCCSLLVSMA